MWVYLVIGIIVGLVVLAVVYAYLIVPMIFRKIVGTYDINRAVESIGRDDLPNFIRLYFSDVAKEMEPHDFRVSGYLTDYQAGSCSYKLVMANRATSTMLYAVSWSVDEPVGPDSSEFHFVTRLVDGRVVDTGNDCEITMPDLNPREVPMQLPEVKDPWLLCRLHRALLDEVASNVPRETIPADAELVAFTRQSLIDEYEGKAKGACWTGCGDGQYRLTFLGAYLLGWSQLPPWSMIRKRRSRREAQAFMDRHPEIGKFLVGKRAPIVP